MTQPKQINVRSRSTTKRVPVAGEKIVTRRARQATDLEKSLARVKRVRLSSPYVGNLAPAADEQEHPKPFSLELAEMKRAHKLELGIKYTIRDIFMGMLVTAVAFLGAWVTYFVFGGQ